MGYLQQFFEQVFQQAPAFKSLPKFQQTTEPVEFHAEFAAEIEDHYEQLQQHLQRTAYKEFKLTDAVRPSMDLTIKPSQGFRPDSYRDEESGTDIPVLMAAVSAENLFSLFMQLVERLGPSVDVVLESSHDHDVSGHVDFYREHIDTPVLISTLWEYEDLLLNDGCTGIAVLNPQVPQEVQFDEHKLLIMYGSPLEQFEHLLTHNGVAENADMQFITEAEHIHSSTEAFQQQFEELKMRLGIDADAGRTELC